MIGLLLHAALIVIVVGALTSTSVGVAIHAFGARDGVFARAGLWAPAVASAVVLAAVLLPHDLFGLPDHCLHHPDHHLHLCLVHGAPMPPLPLSALALVGVTLGGWRIGRVLALWVRSERSVRRLRRSGRVEGDLVVLPGDEPLAFVAGIVRPRVFVSEGVWAAAQRWEPVIAHERAHARRRDPLRRWLASLAATFHWPFASRPLREALHEAQELRADRAAARALGDPLRVAKAIVDWSRALRGRARAGAAALTMTFGAGPLRRRVVALTTPASLRRPRPGPRIALLAAAGVLSAALLQAPELHHSAETLLSLWG
jgi:Zn-dependent protease with chaperone function